MGETISRPRGGDDFLGVVVRGPLQRGEAIDPAAGFNYDDTSMSEIRHVDPALTFEENEPLLVVSPPGGLRERYLIVRVDPDYSQSENTLVTQSLWVKKDR